MKMLFYKYNTPNKAICRYLTVLMLMLQSLNSFSQDKNISEVHLAYASHIFSFEKLGKYLYFKNPDTSWQNESVDTFSYFVIRDGKVALQGIIKGSAISLNLQDSVQEGDIVTYYNFKCRRKDFTFADKHMSFTFIVPFHKWGRKD